MQEATRASAALSLGTRLPMGTGVTQMPVPKSFPAAKFVNAAPVGTGGRKAYTDVRMDSEVVTAEDVAAVIAIPDAMVDDSTINLWNYCRPLLAQAIAIAIDDAAFFGVGRPPTWPVGGIMNAANSGAVIAPTLDAVETINLAMGAVEARGLDVTGHAADTSVRSVLRGVRDGNGAMLLGTTQADGYERPSIYGLTAAYSQFGDPSTADFITGAWKYLVMGVRQDIRFDINKAGVIVDNAGVVQVSGWQDNVTPMKVWARIGCAIIRPVTPRVPAGAIPFAKTKLVGATYPDPADSGSTRTTAKK
jgi:HK97 family phage major capsid protein